MNKKIFVFYGSDLDGFPNIFLDELYKNGYILLALDIKAIELASRLDLQYSIINDWLDTNTMIEIEEVAKNFENNWFKPVHELFTSSGICWPEFDKSAMKHFWLDAITSLKLADIFKRSNIEEVMVIKQECLNPIVHYNGSGIHSLIWEKEIGNILKITSPILQKKRNIKKIDLPTFLRTVYTKLNSIIKIIKLESSLKSLFGIIYNEIIFFKFRINKYIISDSHKKPSFNYDSLMGKIAIHMSPTELSRSKELIKDLYARFPKDFAIISFKLSEKSVFFLKQKIKIPIIMISRTDLISNDLGDRFTHAYDELLVKTSNETLRSLLTALQFHFRHYCKYRWPELDVQFNQHLHIFSSNPPKLLIGAAVNIAEWTLPIFAARRCGIKTISIPHGFGELNPARDMPISMRNNLFDYLLYIIPISKILLLEHNIIQKKKLIGCINCTDINSHSVKQIQAHYDKKQLKILILLNPTTKFNPNQKNPRIYPHQNPKKQMDTIKYLNSPPDDLKERISIKFKVHPNYTEIELFNALGEKCLLNLLPIDADLSTILKDTDLVIGVNHFGSAFIHAIKAEKPYISFMDHEFYTKRFKNSKSSFFCLYEKHITTIHTTDELWDLIRQYFTDPVFAEEMKKDVSIFAKEYLDNSNYPTIGCILEEILKNEKDDY